MDGEFAAPDIRCAGRRRRTLLAIALVGLVAAAYARAASSGFIWDDDDYVTENHLLTRSDGLRAIWIEPRSLPQYYPLVHTTFWIEYRLWGIDPKGYHLVNVALHALLTVLIWSILEHLKIPGAWLAAAIFATHPVHVESVAWITERKNVLSGVFAAAAAFCFLRWHARAGETSKGAGRRWLYMLALVLFLASLLSKTVTVSLPAALLLLLWWQSGRLTKRDIVSVLPMFLIGIPLGLLTSHLERTHVGATGAEFELPMVERSLIAGRAVWFYLGKLIWPAALTFNYPKWDVSRERLADWLPLLFALAVLPALWMLRDRWGRGPLTAALYFGGTLFPALGFFNVYPQRFSQVADHFQYLASLGPIVLAAAGMAALAARTGGANVPDRAFGGRPMRGLSAAILASFATLTAVQISEYENSETLWTATARKNPRSWLAFNNLAALALSDPVRAARAEPFVKRALLLNPREPLVMLNAANWLQQTGQLDAAIDEYGRAIDRILAIGDEDGLLIQASDHRGRLLFYRKRYSDAAIDLRRVADLLPENTAARLQLGTALFEAGEDAAAAREFREVLRQDPQNATARRFLEALDK